MRFALLGAVTIGVALRWRSTSALRRAAAIGVLLVCLVPFGYLAHRAMLLGRSYAVGTADTAAGPGINWDLLRGIGEDFSFFLPDRVWGLVVEPALAVIGLVLLT